MLGFYPRPVHRRNLNLSMISSFRFRPGINLGMITAFKLTK
jgi:hypothetical protein